MYLLRPASATQATQSRPTTGLENRPTTGDKSRPATGLKSRPTSTKSLDKSDSISIQTKTGDTEELISEEDPPKGCWHFFTKGVGGRVHPKNIILSFKGTP